MNSMYAKLCDKGRGTCVSGVEGPYIDCDSKDDDIEGFDRFAGEIDIDAALRVGVFKIYRAVAY